PQGRTQPQSRRPPDRPALRLSGPRGRRGSAPYLPRRRRDRGRPRPPGVPDGARRGREGDRGAPGDAARLPGQGAGLRQVHGEVHATPPQNAYRSVCSVRPCPTTTAAVPGGPVPRTALRICPLCEATCGLTLTIEGGRVTGARGDRDDVFSKGFICPKGAAFGALDSDPDRLRSPLVRVDGELREATWEEAFDAVAAGIRPVVERYGPHAVGIVLGNPNVHTMAGALYPPVLIAGLGTRSLFTASTVDQTPKHVSSGLLYGDANLIPVPDLDRTDHLLLIGANPLESNGSLCTAPDFPGRLKALRARGGTLTVIDPRRTRTARLADRHLAV